jgi:hypothetical protein
MGSAPTWKTVPKTLEVMKMANGDRTMRSERVLKAGKNGETYQTPKSKACDAGLEGQRGSIRRKQADTHGRLCSTLLKSSSLDSLIMWDFRWIVRPVRKSERRGRGETSAVGARSAETADGVKLTERLDER